MSSVPTRELAVRVSARELTRSGHSFTESDEERAPNYSLLATGEKANRVLVAGTLTEVEEMKKGVRGRLFDPSSEDADNATVFLNAGQYQPEAKRKLEQIDTPKFVIVVGKPRPYSPENKPDTRYVPIAPETVTVVDRATRDHALYEIAMQTLERIESLRTDADDTYNEMAAEQYDLNTVVPSVHAGIQNLLTELLSDDEIEAFTAEHGDITVPDYSFDTPESTEETGDTDEETSEDGVSETDADADTADNGEDETTPESRAEAIAESD